MRPDGRERWRSMADEPEAQSEPELIRTDAHVTIKRDPKPLGQPVSVSIDRSPPMAHNAPSTRGQVIRFVKR